MLATGTKPSAYILATLAGLVAWGATESLVIDAPLLPGGISLFFSFTWGLLVFCGVFAIVDGPRERTPRAGQLSAEGKE